MNKYTTELLEKHFDTAFASPDGIKKLRELILTLAMQGKLVPQDPNEQPASELLQEIEAEKQRLVKEGKIKKPQPLLLVTEEEKPYALPQGWEWVKLGTLASYKYGKTPPSKNPIYWMSEDGGFPWISISDLPIRGYVAETAKAVSAEAVSSVFKYEPIPAGSLLMSFKLSIGKTAITEVDAYHNEAIISFIGLGQGLKFWLFWVLYPVANSGKSKKAIKGSTLNSESIGDLLVPLPPSAEQHRIVAKIDELMARCDELEKLRTAQQGARVTVHAAAIKQLLNIAEPDQHLRAQAFLAEHFGELYTVKENVAELRKAILQLAVMGKLVPQDPNEQPASKLLEKIEAAKQRLRKAGKIKIPKSLPQVTEEEQLYTLPQGWEWVRFGEMGYVIGGGTPSKSNPRLWNGSIPWVSPKDMKSDYIVDSQDHIATDALYKSPVKLIPESSLLMVVRGMILAHSFPTALTKTEVTINQDMKALCSYVEGMQEYLLTFTRGMKSKFLSLVEYSTHGTCRIDSEKLLMSVVALPPKQEQERILRRVDILMVMCDELEKRVEETRACQIKLLDALVHTRSKGNAEKNPGNASIPKAQIIDLAAYRASIGCYTLSKLANAQYFGRTAAAKVMYLAQAHIGLDLDMKPEREAAGPLDPWIYDFERQGQRRGWFEVNEKALANGRKKTEYRCLSALSEPTANAEALMTPSRKAEFDRLLYALADKKTEEVEIIATLFAVWNDFLIDGVRPTDAQIISELRENWHERKARFTPAELGRWLDWLRKEGIVPRGLPPRTVHQSKLALH